MPTALILGVNTPTGAYLARLLHARGTAIFGVSDETPTTALAALGITDDINHVPAAQAPSLAATLADATIYAINTGTHAALIAETFAAAANARLCHIADAETLRKIPAILDQAKAIAALRRDHQRPAVNAILHAHDSRLGPAAGLPALITTAAHNAAKGIQQNLHLTETGPLDWGWTAEYVDAIARLAALETPIDLAIASGHPLTVREFTDHAFAFFKISAEGHVHITPATAPPESPIDTARLKSATGWSASTWGRDLVRTLCEGAPRQ